MYYKPIVSIILPVYNSEKYIKEALDSILNQTFSNFEVIVINDASTDNTKEILESYTDKRIKLINNSENLKVVKCLNLGLSIASGEFIARMDADDIALSYRLEKQVAYLSNNSEIDVCASYVHVFGNKEYTLRPYLKHDDIKAGLLFLNIIIHPSVMFRRRVFASAAYNEIYVNAEDYGLWIQLIDQFKFAIVPQVLLKYRIHDNNVSIKKKSNWGILREMNFVVYRTLLNRIKVAYNDQDLETHIDIGFKNAHNLSLNEYKRHMLWLKRIVLANDKSQYISPRSLRNQIIHHIIFLSKSTKMNIRTTFVLLSTLKSILDINDYYFFVRDRALGRIIKKDLQ